MMQSSWYYCDLKPAWHFSLHSYSDPTQLFQMKYELCKMGHFHSYSYSTFQLADFTPLAAIKFRAPIMQFPCVKHRLHGSNNLSGKHISLGLPLTAATKRVQRSSAQALGWSTGSPSFPSL